MAWSRGWVLAWMGLAGCGPLITLDGGNVDSTGGEVSTGMDPPPPTTSPGTTTTPSTTTTPPPPPPDSGGETTMGGISFIDEGFDDGFIVEECDVWEQDCPRGEKCMPWANDGGNTWNALTCRPIVGEPGQPGDPCLVEGSAVSGFDTCELGAMCWDVDPVTLEGVCIAQCTGTPRNTVCDDPDTSCLVAYDGILAVCVPSCSPLLQDCPPGQGCYGHDESFVCLPLDPAGTSGPGGPCEDIDECDIGSECVAPELVPECMGIIGCCTSWCDLSDPMANATCLPGQVCTPYFEEGTHPGVQDEGLCMLPP